jgi:DNA-binding NtrC family response regulator
MNVPQVVVYETGRRWIDHVRARMAPWPVRVRHATSVSDCLQLLRGSRGTTLLVELGARPIDALELVQQTRDHDPESAVIVVGGASQASLELPAREFGAVEFVCGPVQPIELADLIERVVWSRLDRPLPPAIEAELGEYDNGRVDPK